MQKIRFENGLAVAKSKIEYVMCRIEEIRLQLQGNSSFQLIVTEINFNAMFKGLFAPKDKRTPQEKVRIVLETMTG